MSLLASMLIFDEQFYVDRAKAAAFQIDVLQLVAEGKYASVWDHYQKVGGKLNIAPNQVFDPGYYANANQDVMLAVAAGQFNNVFEHFYMYGLVSDGRAPNQNLEFNSADYLSQNPDVADAIAAGTFKGSAFYHWVAFGRDEGRKGGDIQDTFTLTANRDTAGANKFIAYPTTRNENTLNTLDNLTGQGVNPTMEFISASAVTTVVPTMTGIETFNGTNLGTGRFTIIGDNVTGLKTINNSNSIQDFTFQNLQTAVEDVAIINTVRDTNITVANAALSGTDDEANLYLSDVRQGATLTLQATSASNGYETLNIWSDGPEANVLTELNARGLQKINVEGDQNLALGRPGNPAANALRAYNALPNTVTEVDASDFKGNLDLLAGNGIVNLMGGAGDDTFRFANNQFLTNDKVDGGAGMNTLRITATDAEAIVAANANVKNMQALSLSTIGTNNATLRADFFGDAVNTVNFLAGANATYTVRMNTGENNLNFYNLGAAATQLNVQANGTATTDKLNLTLEGFNPDRDPGTEEATNIALGAVNLAHADRPVEQLNIVSNNALANHTIGNITLPNTAGVTNAVTVSGNSNLTIGTLTANQIDASGMTGNAGLQMGGAVALPSGLTVSPTGVNITGSAGNDRLIGSANADTIRTGAGNDTVVSGPGGDVIFLEGNQNRVVIGEVEASAALNGGTFNDIKGFTVGSAATNSDQIRVDVGAATEGFAGLTLHTLGGTAGPTLRAVAAGDDLVTFSIGQNAGANTTLGTTNFIKFTTGVAVAAGTSAQDAFNAALGTTTVQSALLPANNTNMLASFYNTTASQMVLVQVNTGAADSIVGTGDVVTVLGLIDMTAADYAAFGANQLAFV